MSMKKTQKNRLKTQPEREMTQDEQSADDEKKVSFYNNIMYK